jgi:class 3 adenylate cyclase
MKLLPEKLQEQEFELFDAKVKGSIVLIDLTDSTGIKSNLVFPKWVNDIRIFFNIITEAFLKEKVLPVKFLGDAVLFFIPDTSETKFRRQQKEQFNYEYKSMSVIEVFNLCYETKKSYWEQYKKYALDSKYKENFRQITIAVDYGDTINFYALTDDISAGRYDPIGTVVDRCFRMSSIAAPNQLLVSKDFYDKLFDLDKTTENKFYKLHLAKNSRMKGFPSEDTVYLAIPAEDEIQYVISDENRQLVEEMPPLYNKAKFKYLREKIKVLEKKLKGE